MEIGKADDRVIDTLMQFLLDKSSWMSSIVTYALGGIGKSDDRVVDKLVELLSDESSEVRGRTAVALGRIGILDQRVVDFLKGVCEDYKKYNYVVEDPESEELFMSISDWAFRTLWRSVG